MNLDDTPCRTMDSDLWFSEDMADRRTAKAMCQHRCPLLAQCREYAAKHFWGRHVVIAGWEAPAPTSGARETPQVRPPWAYRRKIKEDNGNEER